MFLLIRACTCNERTQLEGKQYGTSEHDPEKSMTQFQSFKSRFVAVAVLLALALLMMAIYTSKIVGDESRESRRLIEEYNLAGATLRGINDHYLSLKSSLYQHTLLLTPELKTNALDTVEKLQGLSVDFQHGKIIDLSNNIKSFTIEHNSNLIKLKHDVEEILSMQDDAGKRFPAVAIMLNDLQPLNRLFRQQLDFAIEEANDLGSNKKITQVLNDLRYAWARHISEVRLFVGNRSGTFGKPDAMLSDNINSVNLYSEYIYSLLHELRDISLVSKQFDLFAHTIDKLILTSCQIQQCFQKDSGCVYG